MVAVELDLQQVVLEHACGLEVLLPSCRVQQGIVKLILNEGDVAGVLELVGGM